MLSTKVVQYVWMLVEEQKGILACPKRSAFFLRGSEPGQLTLITDAPLVAPIKKAAPLRSLAHIADLREGPYVEVSSSRYSVERTPWETGGNLGNPFFR